MKTIDAMGKACPVPVILTRKALRDDTSVTVLVSEKVATENIEKMAKQLGYKSEIKQLSAHKYSVLVKKQQASEEKMQQEPAGLTAFQENSSEQQRIDVATVNRIRLSEGYIVVLDSEEIGHGDSTLGKQLAKSFLSSLTEQDVLPEYILMFNSGVKLAVKDTDTVEDLQTLEKMGVHILECGICVNFFGIKDQLGVGSITNMFRITELMRTSQRVVKP